MSYGIELKHPLLFRDVPQFTRQPTYAVDVGWNYLRSHLESHGDVDLDPDFQRGHVWTLDKQIAFVEFVLRGGDSARNLYFNCPNFQMGGTKHYVLVDGKQRLTAALAFLDDKVPVFGGHYYSEFEDRPDIMTVRFRWHVNNLKTRAEVLQWYLDLNTGGVVHTDEEIAKVQRMLAAEKK